MNISQPRIARRVVLGLGLLALAAADGLAATMEIVRLSPTMIIVQEGRGRTFALNSARGIVVIDTRASAADMRTAKVLIEAEFKRQDYAFVINTHDHWEHVAGNGVFEPRFIVGHAGIHEGQEQDKPRQHDVQSRLTQEIAKEQQILAGLEKVSPAYQTSAEKIADGLEALETLRTGIVEPAITFNDRLTLDLGDRTVRLIYFGKGHSHSDILVHIPEEKVLLTGGACSLAKLPPPFQAWAGTMEVARWIEVLSEFVDSGIELTHIIPGHAPPLSPADLKFIRDYDRELWLGLNEALRDGLTLDAVKSRFALPTRFADWDRLANPTDEVVRQHTGNLERLWALLVGAPATKS
ncbi:MBL fold metallo-hydrolase [Opitutus terrae]|nr:MBL fold metallo-hydrolase [Opitutus terrae]